MQHNSSHPGPVPAPDPNSAGLPPVNPAAPLAGSVVEPAAPTSPGFGPAAPGATPVGQIANPLMSPQPSAPAEHHHNVLETVILVIISLVAMVFIGLFIWKYLEWDAVKTNVDGQINEAIAVAVAENTTKLEEEFVEREKYPYKSFTGPTDYGSVSFEYPKTWNLYIDADATDGGDYEAYFNPGEVLPVSRSTVNALRLEILNKSFDNVAKSYESDVSSGELTMVTRKVGSTVANVYTGEISRDMRGIITIFKVRDKTVLIQTDSELFSDEYYKLLDTVSFIE